MAETAADHLLAKMQETADALWKSYMDGPGGHTETLRQGKYEGFVKAMAMVRADAIHHEQTARTEAPK